MNYQETLTTLDELNLPKSIQSYIVCTLANFVKLLESRGLSYQIKLFDYSYADGHISLSVTNLESCGDKCISTSLDISYGNKYKNNATWVHCSLLNGNYKALRKVEFSAEVTDTAFINTVMDDVFKMRERLISSAQLVKEPVA